MGQPPLAKARSSKAVLLYRSLIITLYHIILQSGFSGSSTCNYWPKEHHNLMLPTKLETKSKH
eukprot:12064451-Ditylum_brightwellii.AAC.2